MDQSRRKIRLVDFWRGNCAKSTAHKWINEGKLEAFRLGRMTFVGEDFSEFVERQAAEREEALKKPKTSEPQVGEGGREPLPPAIDTAAAPG